MMLGIGVKVILELSKRCALSAFVIFFVSLSTAEAEEGPRVFLFDGEHLAKTRQEMRSQPRDFAEELKLIREQAEKALTGGPWTVTDKTIIPPSGDKHDYMSVGPYWWPDPDKPDGLPYIRRDGEVNPERKNYDNVGQSKMSGAVRALATGWYFTEEEKYAERAALLLRTWYLNADTKMNPNLNYAQAIPGRTKGRGIGIIDTASLVYLIDAVGLLESSTAWTEEDQRGLQSWFRQYVDWLRTSKNGVAESKTANNHAVWYDAQVACFALFAGEKQLAQDVLSKVGPRRIATQIKPDGRMPHELARTKSFSYTQMNLRGFLFLARLSEHVDVDLWSFETEDGRSLEGALDWFAPYVAKEKPWTHQQIQPIKPDRAALTYRRATRGLPKPAYCEIGELVDDPLSVLLWPVNCPAPAAQN